MIARTDLRELASFTATKAPVLSMYLNTDLSQQQKDQVKLVVRDLSERARAAGAEEEDVQRLARYVDVGYDWRGRGLVVFSCQAEGLWEPFPLPVPVRNSVFVGDMAYLMPLSNLLDQYAPYAVALVDQERARLFLVDMGGVVKQEDTIGDPIKRQKQGGWSASRFQRHEDKMAERNMRAAAAALSHFCEANRCSRIVLAGTEDNTARFQGFLPTQLRQAVVGTMPAEMGARGVSIAQRSQEMLTELEEQQERELVETLVTTALSGGAAVIGLADTLFALQEGRVLTLVVEEGLSAPGFACPSCDYLYVDESLRCLFCGTMEVHRVRNVVERAMHKAYLQGARVEVIADSPALARAGHIGALLRY
ncbi:MAG: Vms1/Ankzf1 family peptidyl-tRNA hydrolase [Anaerolineae bacterium]|nr:Vms1/Ankzf1 family peptidyl-tRNA hydrolase [Anaerolineae bacterium]